MTDYQNFTIQYQNAGLVLRDAADLIPAGRWTVLTNVKPIFEGFLHTRPGTTAEVDTGVSNRVHTIKRLGDSTLLLGVGGALYRNSSAFANSGWTGLPLGVLLYKPPAATANWAYVGDSVKMRKVRADGTDQKWGISAPIQQAGAQDSGVAGNLTSSGPGGLAYDWVFTYGNSAAGAESNPSPLMDAGISLTAKKALVTVVASNDPQVDIINIYRRGGILAQFRLSVSVGNLSGTVEDNNTDVSIIANESLLQDNYVPFTTQDGLNLVENNTPYVFGPFNGNIFFGVGITGYEGYVFWTNPGAIDSADVANKLEVTGPGEPLINGWVYAATPFVATRDEVYVLDYGTSELGSLLSNLTQFTARLTPVGVGLVAPWAFCVGPKVWLLTRNGIIETDCASLGALISDDLRPIFQGKSVGAFQPIDFTVQDAIRLSYTQMEIHFIYQDTSGALQHLIYDILHQRWRLMAGKQVASVYEDENQPSTRVLMGGADGILYKQDPAFSTDNGSTISSVATTGAFDFGMPNTEKEVGGVVLDFQGTIRVTPLVDFNTTELVDLAQSFSSSVRTKAFMTLADLYCYTFGLKFTWDGAGEIHSTEVLWRTDEEALRHWEFPDTTHGLLGWQHLRDGYICLRSTGTVTLTITVDGVDMLPITLSSTGNEKRKVYFKAYATKGKVFRYRLDSATDFRLYGEDCELNIKSWNTSKGYQAISPFVQTQGGT